MQQSVHVAKFAVVVVATAAVAVGYLSSRVRRARREIGAEIEAALVVALSHKEPPTPDRMRLVDELPDEAS